MTGPRLLIALGHKAQSGKDTVAKLLVEEFGFRQIAYADPLKAACAAAFNVPLHYFYDEKLKMTPVPYWPFESPARMCQRFAQGIRAEYGQDFWAKILGRKLEAEGFFAEGSAQRWVITDMRTPAEAALVREWGGHAVLVYRPRELRGDIGRPEDHWTEVALDSYEQWSARIVNDGPLDALHTQTRKVLAQIVELTLPEGP